MVASFNPVIVIFLNISLKSGALASMILIKRGSMVSTPNSGIPAANSGSTSFALCVIHCESDAKHFFINGAENIYFNIISELNNKDNDEGGTYDLSGTTYYSI